MGWLALVWECGIFFLTKEATGGRTGTNSSLGLFLPSFMVVEVGRVDIVTSFVVVRYTLQRVEPAFLLALISRVA